MVAAGAPQHLPSVEGCHLLPALWALAHSLDERPAGLGGRLRLPVGVGDGSDVRVDVLVASVAHLADVASDVGASVSAGRSRFRIHRVFGLGLINAYGARPYALGED